MTGDTAHGGRRRSAAKHDAILRAATEVFLREGYTRTSVDAIAAAAGVGKQTVYGHFGDKQRLFLAVVGHANDQVGVGEGDLDNLIRDTGDVRADLRAAGERVLRAVTAPEVAALHRMTIAELTHHPELQRSWRDDGPAQRLYDAIADYLAGCDRRGTLTVPDPARAARQFGLLVSVEGQVRSLRGLEPLPAAVVEQITEDTTELIMRAYRPE